MYAQDAVDNTITMSGAATECKKLGFTPKNGLNACIKQRMSSNSGASTLRPDIHNDETDVEETATGKYGIEIGCPSCDNDKRRKDLYRSKKELRKWIFGVK